MKIVTDNTQTSFQTVRSTKFENRFNKRFEDKSLKGITMAYF